MTANPSPTSIRIVDTIGEGSLALEPPFADEGPPAILDLLAMLARKFCQQFANKIRRRLPRIGDKWHLDEVALNIAGVKHWL